MIGYHYTTYRNWLKIRKEGLIPQVDKDGVFDYKDIIWLWPKILSIKETIYFITYLFLRSNDNIITLLAVNYNKNQLIIKNGSPVKMVHCFSLNNYYNHDELSITLDKKVDPKNIKLLKIYDFKKMI